MTEKFSFILKYEKYGIYSQKEKWFGLLWMLMYVCVYKYHACITLHF